MPGERHPPPRYFTEHCLKADCYSMPPQVRGSAAAFLACVPSVSSTQVTQLRGRERVLK